MQAGLILSILLPPLIVFSCATLLGILYQKEEVKKQKRRLQVLRDISKNNRNRR